MKDIKDLQGVEYIELLGLRCKDVISEVEGIVISMSYDLYGCIQAVLDRGLDKDGNKIDSTWYDVCRLKVLNKKPVMNQPDFVLGLEAKGNKGPAEKPMKY